MSAEEKERLAQIEKERLEALRYRMNHHKKVFLNNFEMCVCTGSKRNGGKKNTRKWKRKGKSCVRAFETR